MGIGGAPESSAERGVRSFVSNLSNEGLLRVTQNGRIEPLLAETYAQSPDGREVTVRLRDGVMFHDGSPVDGPTVASLLDKALPQLVGSTYEDVESISSPGPREITIRFRQPSSFVIDALMDVPVAKVGERTAGAGPFIAPAPRETGQAAPEGKTGDGSSTEMRAFDRYYLGPPVIKRIEIKPYPNVRAAWADMLRDQIDALYEVGIDALDSMESSQQVGVYTFDRPYQYIVFLNPKLPKFRAREIRRALNQAIDREALVKGSLKGHGTPSSGPVSSHHWAFSGTGQTFTYNPKAAAQVVQAAGGRLSFTCLIPPEARYEHLALQLKQQLQAVGIDMNIGQVGWNDVSSTLAKPDFEAELTDAASGWSLMRAYRWWHSKGNQNAMKFSDPAVDAALDRVRHAVGDADYRAAVAAFQRAIDDSPPAIFVAWSDRSRAVAKRFEVQTQEGRDILGTLRLWRPRADNRNATHN